LVNSVTQTQNDLVGGAHRDRDITFLLGRHWARDCEHITVGKIWWVEEVGDHHGLGQETGLKCDFDSSRKKWTSGPGSLLSQRFRRRRKDLKRRGDGGEWRQV